MFNLVGILITSIVGGLSGWIAGNIMHVGGVLKNIILGILGGVVGGFIIRLVGISGTNILGDIIITVIGAFLFVALGKVIKKIPSVS